MARVTGMPAQNSGFGLKWVWLYYDFAPWIITATPIEIFFPKIEKNHPGNQGVHQDYHTPNWFYYWGQTLALFGNPSYDPNLNGTGVCRWTVAANTWKTFLSPFTPTSTAGGTWNDARGIDLYAHLCRHEERHRLDFTGFWPNDRILNQDQDEGKGDMLPDVVEPTLVPGRPYNPLVKATYNDAFHYHFYTIDDSVPLSDSEDYCLRRQIPWDNGSANLVDWASPGMQHQTLGNPDD